MAIYNNTEFLTLPQQVNKNKKDIEVLQEDITNIDNIIANTIEVAFAQEIIDARQGEVSLGANITEVKSLLEQKVTQVKIKSAENLDDELLLIDAGKIVRLDDKYESPLALNNAVNKVLVGDGEIVKTSSDGTVENFFINVKKTPNYYNGKANTFDDYASLSHFVTQAKTGNVKVGMIGDSILTVGGEHSKIKYNEYLDGNIYSFAPSGITPVDSFHYRIVENLTSAFKNTTFDFYNYAVGGTRLTQIFEERTYSSVTKRWIDFIKDQDVDLLFVSFGMNHSRFLYARETKYYLDLLYEELDTWTKKPSVIIATSPRPLMEVNDVAYGSAYAQFSRHSTSHTLREIGKEKGAYILDVNHLYNVYKEGIDFNKIFMVKKEPMLTTTGTESNGVYTLEKGQRVTVRNGAKDFILEFTLSFPDFSNLSGSDVFDVVLGNHRDSLSDSSTVSRLLMFPNYNGELRMRNYANAGDVAHYSQPTQTKLAVSGNSIPIRIEKRGNEFNVYRGSQLIIRDRLNCMDVAGSQELISQITGVSTIDNVLFYEGQYIQYMPVISDFEAWGEYVQDDGSTKEPTGGSGFNHGTTVLLEQVYNANLKELVEDIKLIKMFY